MRRPALLLDENVSYHLAHALRERDWDVLHIKDIGMRSAKDPAVLDLAVRSKRIVLTSDFADYSRLDQIYREESRPHPGILLLPERIISEVVTRLEEFDWSQIESTVRFL